MRQISIGLLLNTIYGGALTPPLRIENIFGLVASL